MNRSFPNRHAAGLLLAMRLRAFAHRAEVLVLGLPRGGVPVAAAIAQELEVELDLIVVRKLGVPGHEELAFGAVASGGVRVLNEDIIKVAGVSDSVIEEVTVRERKELDRRERSYRGTRPSPAVRGRIVLLVDDGLATGASMRAAVAALRKLQAARIVVAVPVGAAESCRDLSGLADEVVCLFAPEGFHSVGQSYDDFSQTSDAEVQRLLAAAAR